jgi:dynein light chain roadblock-type
LAHLTRLSQKPGVQSTLILSRETGAIVRTSGLISKSDSANPNSTLPASAVDETLDSYASGTRSGLQSAEDIARLVLKFVAAAGTMVESLDHEDELRLLRLRTKKNELVIVPSEYISIFRQHICSQVIGAKFLLVAIHDTPPA